MSVISPVLYHRGVSSVYTSMVDAYSILGIQSGPTTATVKKHMQLFRTLPGGGMGWIDNYVRDFNSNGK